MLGVVDGFFSEDVESDFDEPFDEESEEPPEPDSDEPPDEPESFEDSAAFSRARRLVP